MAFIWIFLTNKNVALIYLVTIFEQKAKDCAPSGTFQQQPQHFIFDVCRLSYPVFSTNYELTHWILRVNFSDRPISCQLQEGIPRIDHFNCFMLKAQKEGYFNRDLKIRRRWRQRWRGLRAIGLISKTTTLHVHHTYFVRCRCPTTTWNCLFSRFVDDVNKARRHFFSLSELGNSS